MEQSIGLESPTKIVPEKKRRVSLNLQKCVICQDIKRSENIHKCTEVGKDKIVATSKIRKDQIFTWLIEICPDTDSDLTSLDLCCRRSCYTSISNISHIHIDRSSATVTSCGEYQPDMSGVDLKDSTMSRRSSLHAFDWQNCIFCTKKSHKKDKKMHRIEYGKTELIIRKAAEKKQDNDMLLRMATPDLIAQEAAYHKVCYTNYTRFVKTEFTTPLKKDEITFDSAFNKLIIEIENELMVEGKALSMTVLLQKYQSYQSEIDYSYSAQNLQKKTGETLQ